jgi:hypothetical protein
MVVASEKYVYNYDRRLEGNRAPERHRVRWKNYNKINLKERGWEVID